jgi:hypothetical protein
LRDRERLRRAVIELGIASVVGVKTIEPDPPFDLAAVAWAIATMPRKGYAAVAIGGRLRIAEPRMTRLDADIAAPSAETPIHDDLELEAFVLAFELAPFLYIIEQAHRDQYRSKTYSITKERKSSARVSGIRRTVASASFRKRRRSVSVKLTFPILSSSRSKNRTRSQFSHPCTVILPSIVAPLATPPYLASVSLVTSYSAPG